MTKQSPQPNKEKRIQEIANKYHCGDKTKEPFFRKMFIQWLLIKEKTGKDPHEWLKHFDTKTYKDTGAIGWIDGLRAIEAIFEKLEVYYHKK